MDLKDIGEFLLTLTEKERAELNIAMGGKLHITPEVPTCPPGWIYSPTSGACVPNVG